MLLEINITIKPYIIPKGKKHEGTEARSFYSPLCLRVSVFFTLTIDYNYRKTFRIPIHTTKNANVASSTLRSSGNEKLNLKPFSLFAI